MLCAAHSPGSSQAAQPGIVHRFSKQSCGMFSFDSSTVIPPKDLACFLVARLPRVIRSPLGLASPGADLPAALPGVTSMGHGFSSTPQVSGGLPAAQNPPGSLFPDPAVCVGSLG